MTPSNLATRAGHRLRRGFRPGAERLEDRALLSVGDGFLDLAFVSEKYADFAQFRGDIARCMEELLRFEPFRSRASQVRAQTIENLRPLESQILGDRLLVVNDAVVQEVVTASGRPADVSVVLVDQDQYAGSGGAITVAYNGPEMPRMFVHELGHTLAGLIDEYILYAGAGPLDNQAHANVYAGGNPPAPGWSNLVGVTDYAPGGNYENWWRPSPASIMLNLQTPYFNSVSQTLINEAIDRHAGAWTDPTPPTARLAAPANGALVGGVVTLRPTVSDNRGVAWAQLWKDGVLWSTSYAAPFTLAWDAGREREGAHTLQVRAVDAAGNVGASETIRVMVDATKPTVSITSPAPNATVRGAVNVAVKAADANGVGRVTLSVDGVVVATDTTAPYSLPWNSALAGSNARKTLVVTAYDRSGLSATSQVVVTASNPPDRIAPTARIVAPKAGATVAVAGMLTVQVDARDNVAVRRFWITLDGQRIYSSDRPPSGAIKINLKGLPLRRGVRPLQVTVQDAAGNTGRSAGVSVRLV
jgi:hypothetical protein